MNQQHSLLAYKYAQAFLNCFFSDITQKDLAVLYTVKKFFKSHEQALFLMQLSFLETALIEKELKKVCIKYGLALSFEKLFFLLARHKRAFLIPETLLMIHRLYIKQSGLMLFDVTSTYEFLETEKEIIQKFLENKTGKKVVCSYTQDSSLIAGIRLKNDEYIWENSIKNRLHHMNCALKR